MKRKNAEPWTDAKQARMQADQETMVWLLVTIEEARILQRGYVPEDFAVQVDDLVRAYELDGGTTDPAAVVGDSGSVSGVRADAGAGAGPVRAVPEAGA